MNNETAKVILSAYRHDGADAQDPVFTDALQQARLDPELGKWFEEQRAFDHRIFQAVQRIEAPASLKEVLTAAVQGPKVRSRTRPRSRIPWLALAAVLVGRQQEPAARQVLHRRPGAGLAHRQRLDLLPARLQLHQHPVVSDVNEMAVAHPEGAVVRGPDAEAVDLALVRRDLHQ